MVLKAAESFTAFRIYILIAAIVIPIAATIYFLPRGVTIVFPHLYYIPIILAAYWFQRRGIIFSVILSGIYLLLIALLAPPDAIAAALIRVVVFIAISAVVAFLAERLVKEKEDYRTIFESTGTAMVVIGEDMTISHVNSKFEKISGYPAGEIVGRKKWTDFVAAEDMERIEDYLRILRNDPASAPKKTEFGFLDKNGDPHDIFLKVAQIPGGKDSIASLLDITNLKKAEARIEHLNSVLFASHNLHQVITHQKDPALLIAQACEVLVNTRGYQNAWIALFGDSGNISDSTESDLGEVFQHMRDRLDAQDHPGCVKSALVKEGVIVIEDPGTECTDCPLSETCRADQGVMTARLDSGGVVYGIISLKLPLSLIHDAEEQTLFMETANDLAFALHAIKLEKEQLAVEQALTNANKKLNLLSSITRHDILNQVFVLEGYTNLLHDVLPDDPKMQNYIDRIMEMATIIEKQIKFTRDYENLGMNPSMWQRVTDVAERAASGCADRRINVSIDTGALEIFADPMLEKVFFNIFDNAFNHGEHVSEISVTFNEDKEKGNFIIAVRDNGIGIPENMKEQIFRHGVGRHNGFGLFLVKEILSITGMSIRETGKEGSGACFEINVLPGGWRFFTLT